jgi:hypothetical protein
MYDTISRRVMVAWLVTHRRQTLQRTNDSQRHCKRGKLMITLLSQSCAFGGKAYASQGLLARDAADPLTGMVVAASADPGRTALDDTDQSGVNALQTSLRAAPSGVTHAAHSLLQ